MLTSAVMGVVAIPFIASLPVGRTPELVPMTVAHALFGLVLGTTYIPLSQGQASSSRPSLSVRSSQL
jgi:hypothetical protein